MSTREAIDTITEYYYQFDKNILELLPRIVLMHHFFIEGIEDIDIVTADEASASATRSLSKLSG